MNDKDGKEAKRELIFEAAADVFSARGYHNATMSEIALAAGIGKGTIYEYFPSKQQLFQQMLMRGMRIYSASFDAEDLKRRPMREKLYLILELHIEFCRRNSRLTRLVFWENGIQDNEVKDYMLKRGKERERSLQEMLHNGIASGELRELDTYIVALMLSGVIASVCGPMVMDEWEIDPSYLADSVTDVIMNGIKKG
ncbi:MAG TPA: TetR/AcrR family transcriptional regulator [Syntrophomonas sp.]|nr:TetR/AcrR family transcriptional regulator [Syntrophomonas sp.]